MSGSELNFVDLMGGFLSFCLTLFILSYAFGDNLLFRIAIYIFIGVSAGFAAAAAFYSIIWPQLLRPLAIGSVDERLLAIVPLFLSLLLLTKTVPRIAILGSPVMAFLVGVGAATIIGGALLGTLFPQVRASLNLLDSQAIFRSGGNAAANLLNGMLIIFGVVSTLLSFQFGTRFFQNPSILTFWRAFYWVGRAFVAITLGVIFAGIYVASLTALVERFKSIIDFILSFALPS